MNFEVIPFAACDPLLDWHQVSQTLQAGHALPKAEIGDTFLYRGDDTLLSRAAWIDGLGMAVKSATVFPANAAAGKPVGNGGVCLYSDADGALEAVIDYHLVTKWKTAGDSLLAARKLARRDAQNILIVGAGVMAAALLQAYRALCPDAAFSVWSRTRATAERLADTVDGLRVATDLAAAARRADIIACATTASEPVLHGEWQQPGQHVDLVGAFRPDMREADDQALRRARIFVDNRATTLAHIGELKTPLATGVITKDAIIADFYDLASGKFARRSDDEITLFKNGGGAHLDLMVSRYILQTWRNR